MDLFVLPWMLVRLICDRLIRLCAVLLDSKLRACAVFVLQGGAGVLSRFAHGCDGFEQILMVVGGCR